MFATGNDLGIFLKKIVKIKEFFFFSEHNKWIKSLHEL